MDEIKIALLIYFGFISILSVIITAYDKIASTKLPKNRIRESTLLWLSLFGGSAAMLLTMHVIRHKTKHIKFMLGIPIIIIIQAVAAYFIVTKFVLG